jgi:hypothetical protein
MMAASHAQAFCEAKFDNGVPNSSKQRAYYSSEASKKERNLRPFSIPFMG